MSSPTGMFFYIRYFVETVDDMVYNKFLFNFLKIDKRNILTNIYTQQYRNMAAIYRRRRQAGLNSQASTQACNALRLTV